MRDTDSKLPPPEIASAVNLMAHPLAGAAAMSAVSMAVATQMYGMWLGAMTGAAQATQRAVGAIEKERVSAAPVAPRRESATVTSLAEVRAATPKPKPAPSAAAKSAAARPVSSPSGSDDLKLIDGIGPKLEKILNGMGVSTLAAIAAWTDADVARFDIALSMGGRIQRDRWVEQAAGLSRKQAGRA